MRRRMMYGKIHRATVTDANINYPGSISVDSELMKAAGMLAHEQVQVVDINNGARLETYLIEAPAGSGDVVLNGGAARLVNKGDRVIVIGYAEMSEEEAAGIRPKVIMVDDSNRPLTGRTVSA